MHRFLFKILPVALFTKSAAALPLQLQVLWGHKHGTMDWPGSGYQVTCMAQPC